MSKKNENSLDSEFWTALRKDSEGFIYPKLYKNYLEDVRPFESAIHEALRTLALNKEAKLSKPQTVLYIQGKPTKLDLYLNKETVIQQNETVENWCKTHFKSEPYTLVINCIERFSNDLASKIATFMEPRFSSHRYDEASFRITAFIGNEANSHFGAHLDMRGLDVTHFHLGSGSKTMYLWPKEKFEQLSKSKKLNIYQFKPFLDQADNYKIETNDVLFFPADQYYHIGEYEGFSMALAIGFFKENPHSLFLKAMESWKEEVGKFILKVPENYQFDKPIRHQIPDDLRSYSIESVLEEFRCGKESNAGMYFKPITKKIAPVFLEGKNLSLMAPFKLIVLVEGDKNVLYARGKRWNYTINDSMLKLIEKLNNGEEVEFRYDDDKNRSGFLSWLFTVGSLKISTT